jgi:hypothetical protein
MSTAAPSAQPPSLGEIHPQDVYLPEAIAIAKEERASMQPNLNRVLRPDVLAVWDGWHQSGVPVEKIGLRTYNGLINVTAEEVTERLAKHRQGAVTTIVTRRQVENPPPAKGATMSETPDITFEQWQATRAQSNGAAVSTKVDTPPHQVATKVDTPQAAVPAVSPTKGELLILDPTAVYPAEVIQAAKEQEASDGRRDLTKVLTDDVLAIWHRWNTTGGVSMAAIGKKRLNGLIDVHLTQVSAYLVKYRERLAAAELSQPPAAMLETTVAKVVSKPAAQTAVPSTSPGRKAVVVKQAVIDEPPPTPAPIEAPETTVAETPVIEPTPEPTAEAPAADPLPKPEIEPLETAVAPFAVEHSENLPTFLDREYRPRRPGPGDALAALAALVNNEQLRIKGSVKLNLEIEFGE